MTAITTDLSVVGRKVWIQREGREPMRLILEPHTEIIDDVKQMVFGDSRDKYQAFCRGQYLRSNGLIPTDASFEEPIQFKSINGRRSIPSNDDDDDAGVGISLEARDERRTRTMHTNSQLVGKCNKCMNKWQSNYDPDVADNVSSSRDCLLSTGTNSSDDWKFNGLLWEAASALWRRVTGGHTTLYKSKSE